MLPKHLNGTVECFVGEKGFWTSWGALRSMSYHCVRNSLHCSCGLQITVCHYPPGTSKWNPIEHRLFSQITATWSGYVLRTLLLLLAFIRRTTTATGLTVTATHFDRTYPSGVKVSKADFKAIQLTRHEVCPQWNYTIRPRRQNTA
jgi:hypothetical protein